MSILNVVGVLQQFVSVAAIVGCASAVSPNSGTAEIFAAIVSVHSALQVGHFALQSWLASAITQMDHKIGRSHLLMVLLHLVPIIYGSAVGVTGEQQAILTFGYAWSWISSALGATHAVARLCSTGSGDVLVR